MAFADMDVVVLGDRDDVALKEEVIPESRKRPADRPNTPPDSILSLLPDGRFRTPNPRQLRMTYAMKDSDIDPFEKYCPNEVTLSIMALLNIRDVMNMMATCKRLYALGCADRYVLCPIFNKKTVALFGGSQPCWNGVDMGNRTVHVKSILKLTSTTALRLNGANVYGEMPRAMELFTSKLRYLDASNVYFSAHGLDFITPLLNSTSQLTCLSLSGCRFTPSMVDAMSRIVSLLQLDLSSCEGLEGHAMGIVLTRCSPFLQALNLSSSRIGYAGGMAVASQCGRNLMRLDMSGTAANEQPEESIDDNVVVTLVRNCPNLKELNLSDNPRLGDVSMQYIANLSRLRELSLSRCFAIHPMQFLTASQVSYLSVFGCVTEAGEDALRARLLHTRINDISRAVSTIARATVPPSVTSIWGQKTKQNY